MVDDWYGNTAIYTAVTTDFEYMGKNRFQEGIDYIFFTDGSSKPIQDTWRVEKLPDLSHLHPRRAAKLPKVNPHFFDILTKYKYTIWIDGDMQIIGDNFAPDILSYMDEGVLFSPHFDGRDCAYSEATIRPLKYVSEPLDQQVEFYKQDGFPENLGLFEGGIIARDMTNRDVRELGQVWYIQNMVFSYQDQVSLPYVLWKTKIKYSVLPKSFRDFEWVVINAHKREE